MKLELKSIGYWSMIKISFVVNFCLGLIIGLFYALFLGFFLTIADSIGGEFGAMGGFSSDGMPAFGFMIILFPLMFGFFSAVFNTIVLLILTFVYNIISGAFGGLEFDFAEIREHVQPQYQQQQSAPITPDQSSGPRYGADAGQVTPTTHDPRTATPTQQSGPGQSTPATPPPPPPPVEPYSEPHKDEENKDSQGDAEGPEKPPQQ